MCTNATTRTYTRQTGSSSTAGETLPAGLAAAILAQRGGDLMSEEVTIRLGDSFPTLGDADVVTENNVSQVLYLQSFEVDCYDLTAQLHFGRPAFLSPEDMRDLLLGFRQRGFASNVPNRGEPDADDNMEDAGGVQPLKSSSIVVSSVEKTTVKGSGNAGNKITLDTTSSKAAIKIEKTSSGTVNLDSADVGSGKTAQFRDLTYTDSNGTQQTVKVLSTAAVTIPPGGSSTTTTEDAITGISFAFDSNNQLVATLTKKRLTVIAKTDISAGTANIPLYKQKVVRTSNYDDASTHKFVNTLVDSVRTTANASSGDTEEVFEATAHEDEMDS